ncbi:MAG: hypothetical protein ACOYU0_04290 [Nitrospirota bacterium]
MKNDHQKENRILALDPANRGFGFAVLEGLERLIDWGVKEARENRNDRCLCKVRDLVEQYQPDVVVVEAPEGSRRGRRVKNLIKRIIHLASKRKIKVCCFSRQKIREAFSQYGAYTKHQIATAIAERFPELSPRLPPFRKPWMSEDYRMAIFDAVSFALTFFFF